MYFVTLLLINNHVNKKCLFVYVFVIIFFTGNLDVVDNTSVWHCKNRRRTVSLFVHVIDIFIVFILLKCAA